MNIVLSILLFLKVFFLAVQDQKISTQPQETVLCNKDFLSPALLELLDVCGIEHEGTLESIVEKTQLYWLQGKKERWEFDNRYNSEATKIWPLLEELGVLRVIHAPIQEYDYAFVHGGLLSRMQSRIAFLVKEWERGVRFKKIVLLTCDRTLQPHERIDPAFQNEADVMKFLYEMADMPEEMRQIPMQFVNAPKHWNNGNWRRPGTIDTIREWLITSPKKGSCLAISNQPYNRYQHAIFQKELPKGFTLFTAGHAADENTSIAIHLDNLARWLYVMRSGDAQQL